MHSHNRPTLALIPNFKIKLLPNDQIIITRKFIEAVLMYESLWNGRVKVLIEEEKNGVDEVDQKVMNRHDLPFEMEFVPYDSPNLIEYLKGCVVIGSVDYHQNHLSQLCREHGIPCIYTAEYTLKTRQQIIAVSTTNPLKRLRQNLWAQQQEKRQRRAIALADGLQCNGFPIFEEYRSINSHPMLYLDTRITEDMMATQDDVEKRAFYRSDTEPLQLVFSGRLNHMKGADHLIEVAQQLKRLHVPYHLYISGAGVLEEPMKQRIQQESLGNEITMLGVPDFKSEFFPFVKSKMDLFICCHRQGDPSCTYIETMSAGVPIVGYGNEAFEKLSNNSHAGWVVPLNRPDLLARQVANLNKNREEITTKAMTAQKFAQEHTFLETFRRRVEHAEAVYTDVAARQN
ncbi:MULTISPECIES: glycosyltransferase [unclassified Leptolyngbya]|uniref:glycosyltransferase n=1 Tax=unclassified Leptolyngbya TaxID=2650499 RepID=UPI001686FC60|nr:MULTISPECIES: glycosyltransferase [unclassified Leptolyngbya]MBD1913653.1 glycosyltransferase [Leptolyngbya sp. FACHB-8]MBD2158251.1 glycosyltransferase [Leptolyngbya sp. FACHB-16]